MSFNYTPMSMPGTVEPFPAAATCAHDDAPKAAWRPRRLPVLRGLGLTLRELRLEDASSLMAHLSEDQVTRFITPPPTTLAGFEQFIRWAHTRRSEGRYVCFAVVPEGHDHAVGMFQVHLQDAATGAAEWGFVLGRAYWGTGMFLRGALLVMQFVFDELGVERLEARACVENGRGNGALRKLGAGRERLLRRAFERHGRWHDQVLWTITPEQWRDFTEPRGSVQ